MLTSSMNSILWNNLIVRNDNHEHESFNIPGTDRGYTDDNEHQTNDSHHHHGELKTTLTISCPDTHKMLDFSFFVLLL